MAKNELINIYCFGKEVGRIGLDEQKSKSFFQFNPEFLKQEQFSELIPQTGVVKRIPQTQVFTKFNSKTFKGLPPFIADSLPDAFGNTIFTKWLESKSQTLNQVSVLEQLAYVANRGMGALEYLPAKKLPRVATIDISEIMAVLQEVLDHKSHHSEKKLDHDALFNIFKVGTSAGGARPKILISEHTKTGRIIPGDINHSKTYTHYLVKLNLEEEKGYIPELVEYSYYLTAKELGIEMMPSKLIDNRHFATERFDRQNGEKIHSLTATGLTGWDFLDPDVSSYENLFDLANFLKVPHKDLDQLYLRMVFNLKFKNIDDHLKNHSFSYSKEKNKWKLSPAYDLTFAMNPLMNYRRINRALSINGKRSEITEKDLLALAEKYTIRNPKKVFREVERAKEQWLNFATQLEINKNVVSSIQKTLENT